MSSDDTAGNIGNRRAFLKTASAVAFTGMAGCAGGIGGGGEEDETEYQIKLAASETGTIAPLFKKIKDDGIDKEHDLNLNMQWMGVPAAEQNFLNGNTWVGFLGPIPTSIEVNQGSTVRNLFPGMPSPNYCIVREEVGASSFEDLEGLTIGTPPEFFFAFMAFEFFTALNGMEIEDFNIQSGNPGAQVGFAHQGEFDAMIHWDPYVTRIMEGGEGSWDILFNYAEEWKKLVGAPMALTEWSVHKPILDSQPGAVRAFADTFFDAAGRIQENPVENTERYSENIGLESQAQIEMYAERTAGTFYTSFNEETREGHKELCRQAHEFGVIEDEPPIDTQFVDLREI